MNALLNGLAKRALTEPDAIVLRGSDYHLTAAQLYANIEQVTALLVDSDAKTIGLYADNSPDWIVADLACQRAGKTLIPIPTFFSAAQIQHVVVSAGIDQLIYSPELKPQLDTLNLDTEMAIPTTSLVTATLHTGLLGAPILMPKGTDKITFTSGSTGRPKGVCLSTVQCLTVAQSLHAAIAIDAPRHLCLLPLSTLLENIGGVYLPLIANGCVIALPGHKLGLQGSSGLNIRQLTDTITREQPTTLILIPQMLAALDQALAQGWQPPTSLQFVAVGGARVSASLVARTRAAGLPVYEGYGLSECGSVVALNYPGADRANSSGKLLKHLRARIENEEIMIEGNTFLGYLNQPDSWHQATVATGDLGQLSADNFLTISGRRKNLLITSFGRNISPEWIESELLSHRELAQASAQVIVTGDGQPFCVALIYANANTADAVIQASIDRCNQQLPDYARIGRWLRLSKALTREDNLLTDNGRPRREPINNLYADAIASLYDAHNTHASYPAPIATQPLTQLSTQFSTQFSTQEWSCL